MKECTFCHISVKNEVALRNHYRDVHPGETPYVCSTCHMLFTHKSSLSRHKVSCAVPLVPATASFITCSETTEVPKDTNILETITEDEKTERDQPKNQKSPKFELPADYRCTELSSSASFPDWISIYRDLTTDTADTPVANSVEYNVLNFVVVLQDRYKDLIDPSNTSLSFSESLDDFIDDQLKTVLHSTVTQRMRYLRWYICYLVSVCSTFQLSILDELDGVITEMQGISTHDTVNTSLLNILNPYALVAVSNCVVEMLRDNQMNIIDPFIGKFFRAPASCTRENLVDFGNKHLICWVELAIRFTNAPLRIQATSEMVGHKSTQLDFVAQLVVGEDRISRLIQNDKLGTHKQILSVPLDPATSGYLLFYYTYCRPDPTSDYVFQSTQGHKWKRASKDLKTYLTKYGIDCDRICPNGRFIHTTRNIGIACFSVLCEFNIARIRNYCTLLRHQLVHVEHIYSPWMKLEQSGQAAQDVLALRGLVAPDTNTSAQKIQVTNLGQPTDDVSTGFRLLFGQYVQSINRPIIIRKCDASSQTEEHSMLENVVPLKKRHLSETDLTDEELPECGVCHIPKEVLGPIGLARSSYFACFYTQCTRCHGKTNCKASRYFKLGFRPVQRSKSAQPRNLAEIKAYVLEKAGVRWE